MPKTENIFEYALYRGDEFITLGTVKELAEFMEVKEASVRFWTMPSYIARIKQYHNSLRAIKIEEEDE